MPESIDEAVKLVPEGHGWSLIAIKQAVDGPTMFDAFVANWGGPETGKSCHEDPAIALREAIDKLKEYPHGRR